MADTISAPLPLRAEGGGTLGTDRGSGWRSGGDGDGGSGGSGGLRDRVALLVLGLAFLAALAGPFLFLQGAYVPFLSAGGALVVGYLGVRRLA